MRILFDAGNYYEELCYFTIRLYDQSDGNAKGRFIYWRRPATGFMMCK